MASPSRDAALRFLAPAFPILHGSRATVRFSIRRSEKDSPGGTAAWDWGDGAVDVADLPSGRLVHARSAHLYASPGVYLVRVHIRGTGLRSSGVRYVTVRPGQGEVAGCGLIRSPAGGTAAFGVILHLPKEAEPAGHLQLRYRADGVEVTSAELGWVITEADQSVHLGGSARVRGRHRRHLFRLDASRGDPGRGGRQRLGFSLYAPGDVPGRDSPFHRVSGRVSPGRMVLEGRTRSAPPEPGGADVVRG